MSEKNKLFIQKVTLTEQPLVNEIGKIIEENSRDSIFLARGYIRITYVYHGYKNKAVLRAYHIKPDYQHADDEENERLFPLYYTEVKGKLVAIYDPAVESSICYQISKNSKRKFQRLLEPYLSRPVWIDMPRADGKGTTKAKFRPESLIQIHGGKILYIFDDESSIVEASR